MKYKISISKNPETKVDSLDYNNLSFGKQYSDHMFLAEYDHGTWSNCRIVPFQNLDLHPATSCLHYGQMIFEGMKAYKDVNDTALLFRPDMNLKRMNKSAIRMGMPEIPEQIFMDSLYNLIKLDQDWIPNKDGYSLYIRPVLMAIDEFIGIRPTEKFLFYIICSPAQPYYSKPVKVMTTDKYVRAFQGGVGYAKAAGNYGASMLPLKLALAEGYDQILWLDGIEFKYAEEIGSMNVFFVIDDVFITPELDGTILDGVTRNSVIQLAQSLGVKVEERKISLDEIAEANKLGRLQDAFGTGTAASVCSLESIFYKGNDIMLPPVNIRKWSPKIKKMLDDIKTRKVEDSFEWVHEVESKMVEA
jgi:branched-chain amino acid aminotransferase